MINESVLLESRTLRRSVAARTEVLDRVKALSLLPDGLHVTTAMVAAYFGVGAEAVRQIGHRHRDELEASGMTTLRGADLDAFKRDVLSRYSGRCPQPRSALTLYSRRAVLNVAMLLRDSDVARHVRAYLLDTESTARTRPVDNSVHKPATEPAAPAEPDLDDRIDRRITHILGRTVVPLLDALVETAGEHRRELLSAREDMQRSLRRLARYEQRLNRLERARTAPGALTAPPAALALPAPPAAALDALSAPALTAHVAGLLGRDGCTSVRAHGEDGDRGAHVTARTADGRRVVMRCTALPHRLVDGAAMRQFVGTTAVHRADVALSVATCRFSPDAQDAAERTGVVTVHGALLAAWTAGSPLRILA